MSAVWHLTVEDQLRHDLAALRAEHRAELSRFRAQRRRERHADRQRAARAEQRAELWKARWEHERAAPGVVLFGRLADAANRELP